jgi:hypothetical protein
MSERFFEFQTYLSPGERGIRERERGPERGPVQIAENLKEKLGLETKELENEFFTQEKEILTPLKQEPESKNVSGDNPQVKKILDKITAFFALSTFAFGLSQGLFAKEARAEEHLSPKHRIELRQEGETLYEKLENEFYQAIHDEKAYEGYVPHRSSKESRNWFVDQMLKIIREKGAVPAKIEYLGSQQIQFFYNKEGKAVDCLIVKNWRGSVKDVFKEDLDLVSLLREEYNKKLDQGVPFEELKSPEVTFKKLQALASDINSLKAILSDLKKTERKQEASYIQGVIKDKIQKIIKLAGEEVLDKEALAKEAGDPRRPKFVPLPE